jgi:hypothetical protein
MHWPPRVGELLPRAAEPIGMRPKLAGYSLNRSHETGGPKAEGFLSILGITLDAIDYLEREIRGGILIMPISAVRNNPPHGVNCVVEIPVRGLDSKAARVVVVRTIWGVADREQQPRLVNAFPKP